MHGSGGVGNEDIGGGRCNDRLPLRVAAGILGQTDKRGHDSDTHDRASHDAFTALPESSADHGLSGVSEIFKGKGLLTGVFEDMMLERTDERK